MKFFALYYLDSSKQREATDALFANGKRRDFFFVPVRTLVDLPDCLKRQKVGITRWGFYGIARSTPDYTLEQLRNYITPLFFYEEIPTDGDLSAWFEQHCKVKKLDVVNPATGFRKVVTKVTTVKASAERDAREELEHFKKEVEPKHDAMQFYWTESEKIAEPYVERLIDLLIQLQTDYNKKLNERFESYWYNERKGFDFMSKMLRDEIMPRIAEEYIVLTEQLLDKYAKRIIELPEHKAIVEQAEKMFPKLFQKWYSWDDLDERSPESWKKKLQTQIEHKTKDTGITFFFKSDYWYIRYLDFDFYIDPKRKPPPAPLQQTAPPSAKKPRIVYPPNFKH